MQNSKPYLFGWTYSPRMIVVTLSTGHLENIDLGRSFKCRYISLSNIKNTYISISYIFRKVFNYQNSVKLTVANKSFPKVSFSQKSLNFITGDLGCHLFSWKGHARFLLFFRCPNAQVKTTCLSVMLSSKNVSPWKKWLDQLTMQTHCVFSLDVHSLQYSAACLLHTPHVKMMYIQGYALIKINNFSFIKDIFK